ncbi:hypothetical protein WOLCODRAFT_25325 [Wolfiporia cocos MD-104 SS10]|uniref:Uncharacterized protein n=1 Tax=Wolfiporia cocos (strain MD-104) TaxID=742152 RepID=A0A2H3JLF7_WOLCO|nr:hypothetical protein WOLCODRAFT_25325 [Wolfiporia cocos MD-104 SS10]
MDVGRLGRDNTALAMKIQVHEHTLHQIRICIPKDVSAILDINGLVGLDGLRQGDGTATLSELRDYYNEQFTHLNGSSTTALMTSSVDAAYWATSISAMTVSRRSA